MKLKDMMLNKSITKGQILYGSTYKGQMIKNLPAM